MPDITAQLIEDAIEVEILDRDLYRSKSLWKPSNGRGVFGGQTIAQATWAATLSVVSDEPDPAKRNFGNADLPIIYAVSRLRDGRSYSTRSVLATQNGVPIFSLTASFCLPEPNQPTTAYPMPMFERGGVKRKVPEPEEVLPTEDRLKLVLDRELPEKVRDYVERYQAERLQSSIETRNCDKNELGDVISSRLNTTGQPHQACWFRSRAPVRQDPAFQKCVLAYASDLSFIGTAARAVNLGSRTKPSLGMLASLDHAMYFYDDSVDATEFLLFFMECPVVRSGRGVVSGRIYKRDGTLAVLCTQEGVVRAANM